MRTACGRKALVYVSLAPLMSDGVCFQEDNAWKNAPRKLLLCALALIPNYLNSRKPMHFDIILSLCGANFHLACQAAFPRAIMYQVYTQTKIQSKTRSIAQSTALPYISKSADCKQILAKFKMKKGMRMLHSPCSPHTYTQLALILKH